MVDSVEKRNDQSVTDHLGRGEGQRLLQLRRLRRHPERINVAVEGGRGRHVDLEITEHDALNAQPAVVCPQRFWPQQQGHLST